jgi:serine/threonine-protein kinase ULK/ATG1
MSLPSLPRQPTSSSNTPNTNNTKIIRNAKTGNEYAIFSSENNQPIGRGSFATVWKGRDEKTRATVAVKEMSTKGLQPKLREALELEITVLRNANHRNIMTLVDVVDDLRTEQVYLILEYCAGGDLSEFIRKRGRVSEAVAKHFMTQLASGLSAMRLQSLVHRDLKPQNLLLSERSSRATLKIADFGFARYIQPHGGMADTVCGSPLYMAPEILKYRKYDAKADLWSVGAILFEMVVGKVPFTGQNQVQLLHNIERSDARIPTRIAETLSPECVALMRSLLRRDPRERLGFDAFFNHPFFISSGSSGANASTKNDSAASTATAAELSVAMSVDININSNNTSNNTNNRKMSSGGSSNEDGDMQFQMDSMNEAQLNVNNNNNNNNTSLKQTIVEEEIAPTRSFPIELNNNNFLQRENSMLSSSYKCFGTSPSEVVRNEIALAARDLRGGRKNVGTVATTTMKRCSSSPQQQQNVIAKFSPGSPPSMAFTSDSLEIDDDDYVMVTSPGTGFVPRNPAHTACYQTPPRLGASPLSRGTSPKEPSPTGMNVHEQQKKKKDAEVIVASANSESSSLKTSMLASSPLASSPILSPSQLLSKSTTNQQMMRKISNGAGTLSSTSQPFSSRGTEPFAKIMSNMDKAKLLERAAACLRDASAEHWNAGSRLHALSVGLISLNALDAAHDLINVACEEIKIPSTNNESTASSDVSVGGAPISMSPSSLDEYVSQISLANSAESADSSVMMTNAPTRNTNKAKYAEATAIKKRIKAAFMKTHARCEKATKGIANYGVDAKSSLPDGLELAHDRALQLTRAGAVEELVGNFNLATASYGEAQTLLLFLLMDESGLRKRSNNRNSAGEDLKRIAAFAEAVSRRQIAARR